MGLYSYKKSVSLGKPRKHEWAGKKGFNYAI